MRCTASARCTALPHLEQVVRFALVLLALAASLATGSPLQAQGSAYQIIVHSSNPLSSISRDEASKLFLRKATKWSTGAEVVPVDQPEGSDTRAAFTKAVLKKSVAAVKSYWQQQIFSGRGVPPTEKGTDADVVAFVRANPNAIGYVSSSAPVSGSVKILTVREN